MYRNARFLSSPHYQICKIEFASNIKALAFLNLDHFISASKAAENPDPALGNAEMLRQQFNDCLVGLAFPGRLFDFSYEAIAFLAELFSPGIGLYLNPDFRPTPFPIYGGCEIPAV